MAARFHVIIMLGAPLHVHLTLTLPHSFAPIRGWLKSLPSGSDWHASIGSGLHNCKGLIAVITKKYITSRYCTSELYSADSDQKSIFPVIFEDVDFEQSQKSMGVKYVIGGINWSFFRPEVDDYVSSLSKLMQGMSELGKLCTCSSLEVVCALPFPSHSVLSLSLSLTIQ